MILAFACLFPRFLFSAIVIRGFIHLFFGSFTESPMADGGLRRRALAIVARAASYTSYILALRASRLDPNIIR